MKLRGGFLIISICAISAVTHAQHQDLAKPPLPADVPSHLQVARTTGVPFAGWWGGKARCDDDGNVYLHLMNAETERQYLKVSRSPISKISPNGSLGVTFRITDAGPDLSAIDFFVSGKGDVYQAAWSKTNPAAHVIAFSKDGSVRSTVSLDAPFFTPYQIVVFSSGELLVSGTEGPENRAPYSAVFGPGGNLIKKIYEPEDEDSRRRAEAGEPNFQSDYTNSGNLSVWHGDAALGSDGNAYLLRAVSPALIYVISHKGEIVRKLLIESPGSGLVAERVRSAAGRLAITFLESHSTAGMTEI